MLYMPSIFNDGLMEDFFNDCYAANQRSKNQSGLMRTDIVETSDSYELDVELPGYSKENLQLELKDGYLSITAAQAQNNDEKDKNGRVIRRERYTGSVSRSFYVGDALKEEDIKASFSDGVLKLLVPKKDMQPKQPEHKYITIQ